MLSPNEMQTIIENYKIAQNNFQIELIRIGVEVDKEIRKNNHFENNNGDLESVIEAMFEKKKKTDERYIQAERTLRSTQKEFNSMFDKF